MTTATWVVQTNKIRSNQVKSMVDALNELGEPWVEIALSKEDGLYTDLPQGTNLIPWGSTSLVALAQEHGWKHCYFDDEIFDARVWHKNRKDMLNYPVFVSLSEMKRLALNESFLNKFFIRPVKDMKSFHGHVSTKQELIDWVTNLEAVDCELKPSEIAAVSPLREILMEWRYFVVDGKVITGSSYRHKGNPHLERDNDLEEPQRFADIWLPHPCCVMDLALTEDGLKVIEFNGINASGIYAHDVKALCKAMSDYARRINNGSI